MGNTSQMSDEIREKCFGGQCSKYDQEWEALQAILFGKDHLGRDLGEGYKPMEPKGKEDKEEKDRVLMQLKKTQAYVSVWGLLMAF